MDITAEDLELEASAMWEDASPPALPNTGSGADKGTTSATVSNRGPTGKKKIEWKHSVKNAANGSPEGGTNIGISRSKEKAQTPESMFFLGDLVMASPNASVPPKKELTPSKSMKWASQDEPTADESPARVLLPQDTKSELKAVNDFFADPYNLPISPTSSRRPQNAISAANLQHLSSKANSAKTSSPLTPGKQAGANNPPRPKQQKRVAKRSFLDLPEAPPPETEAKLPQKPSGRILPAKPTKTAKTTKPTEPAEPVAKKQRKAASKASKKRVSPQLVPGGLAAKEDVMTKLRPRHARVPIIISSDAESSDMEGDNSGTGFVPEVTQFSSYSYSPGQSGSIHQPIKKELSVALDIEHNAIHTTVVSAKSIPSSKEPVGPKREKLERSHNRNEDLLDVETQIEKNIASSHKRHYPQDDGKQHDRREKKQKCEPHQDQVKEGEHVHQFLEKKHKLEPVTVQPGSSGDPFVEDLRDNNHAKSQFTKKLLESAALAYPKPMESMSGLDPTRQNRAPSHVAENSSHLQSSSDDIARQMMRLFADGDLRQPADRHGRRGTSESVYQMAPDIWLEETDTYKETSQIMGYVCKTILRFLKSKEAAIDDVANEYHQRGAVVISRVEELHTNERDKLLQQFENNRIDSLKVFSLAYRDIHCLAAQLRRVNLAPAINDVLANNAGSRLRTLQAELV